MHLSEWGPELRNLLFSGLSQTKIVCSTLRGVTLRTPACCLGRCYAALVWNFPACKTLHSKKLKGYMLRHILQIVKSVKWQKLKNQRKVYHPKPQPALGSPVRRDPADRGDTAAEGGGRTALPAAQSSPLWGDAGRSRQVFCEGYGKPTSCEEKDFSTRSCFFGQYERDTHS